MGGDFLETLEYLAETTGVEFDPRLARSSLSRAWREIPGETGAIWPALLKRVGGDVGLRVVGVKAPLREALATASPVTPVAAFGGGRWVVATGRRGRRTRVAAIAEGEADRWVGEAELAGLLGLANPAEPADWALVQALATCSSPHGGHGHDHHGHEAMTPFRRLVGLIRPEAQDVRVVSAFAVAVGLLSLATPLAVESLVSTVAMSLLTQQLVVLSLVLLVCLSLAAAIRSLQTFVVEILQRRLFVRVASDLAHRLPRVRVDAYDREYGPELANRFFDVMTVQKVGASLLLDGLTLVIQAFFGLVVLAFYHPYLLSFDLVILAALAFAVFLLGRGAVATSIRESRAKYAVAASLEELARSPLAFKHDGGAEFAMARADALTRAYLTARGEHFAVVLRQVVFALGFQAASTAALLGLGGWLVIQGQLTLGQLVAAELIVATVAGSFAKLGKHLEGWYDLMAAVDKIGHLIDLPMERRDGEPPATTAGGAELGLRGLSYAYGGRRPVLDRLDLSLAPGERVAVVGPGGSGKSTLADLILGLRAPTAGHVALDGVNLRDLRLDSIRERAALVKGLDVIEGTILENVRMGRPRISQADAYEALESVGLTDEFATLDEGLHTRLAPHGAPISQGQARRLMLARALAGRPRLLVLDESLDGLDLDSRRRVLETVFDDSAPWTLLVITHDQDVARRCDRCVRLRGGRFDHATAAIEGPADHAPAAIEGRGPDLDY
ncbi:peptidase domain-containing ABC transporter [Paludisphaera soli]|uniref:peptidase domain-containing ABC transporter n=1 Tax=Paludisphaera soli TaxID=2712865 RepID=UPI0019810547|nr:ABC transporter ATP-binding protein [Paludisphaera soli]